MNMERISFLQEQFDAIAHTLEGFPIIEYWNARDLQLLLDYTRWENFEEAIKRAMISCNVNGLEVSDHFRDGMKTINLPKGAIRKVKDFHLTRYACYLIAQTGDPRKEVIAFAQSYFALQTRRQELLQDRLQLIARLDARERLRESEKKLSQNIYERGVDDKGFGRIRSAGDTALFGGHNTAQMKNIMSVPDGRPLADFLPALTVAAKNLATEMTNHNVDEQNMQGENQIKSEHIQNNASVRNMLMKRGIHPEALPPAEDIKKLERRVKREAKNLAESTGRFSFDENGKTKPSEN